jgi:hypothetical protein
MEIIHKNYSVAISEPTLYVDNQSRGRSGHMTHAMAEFAPGCFIDFNSNCSAERWYGHSPYGWVEYRISRDAGKTYSEIQTLPYSVKSFLDGVYMISVEKAVACDDGTIVAVCLRNDGTDPTCCEPWFSPMAVTSADEGRTWTEPVEICPYRGRTYDAVYRNGTMYVLHFCNEHFLGCKPEHQYRIFTSTDSGKSFQELSVIPFDTTRRGYGSILFDDSGRLHAYAYNESAETEMDHAISEDGGKTWTVLPPCHLEKGIRNPQTALIDGVFVLHGRAVGARHFVFYTSENGSDWDEGTYVAETVDPVGQYYSNNLNLKDEKGNFLLVQYSESYDGAKVNIKHLTLRVNK